ncbi:MAG: DUF1800 family protein [Chloroflexi bacterium]|nr:DUF1800 family protein [Chloroflexota bacterium]
MPLTRRAFLKDMAFAAALVGLPQWVAGLDEEPPMDMLSLGSTTFPWPWRAPQALGPVSPAITALNRIAFGPRPGDFERVQAMGVDAFVEEQLRPETIDDRALDARLASQYPTLGMSIGELVQKYPQQNKPSGSNAQTQGPRQVIAELEQATVLRAIFSQRQLQETLVDFWSNHFSIFIGKGAVKWLKTVDDREVIRKYAFGKFGDLLHASAASPAMLEYLDNRSNVKGIPNENYAREVMELHTLGVDGGYMHEDVYELARAFTGWTIRPPQVQRPPARRRPQARSGRQSPGRRRHRRWHEDA